MAAEPKEFKDMTLVQKLKTIETMLDAEIRPMLEADGGNMEVVDIKEEGENINVYIQYMGACQGCPSATTGTLYAIQEYLTQKVDESIRVIPG